MSEPGAASIPPPGWTAAPPKRQAPIADVSAAPALPEGADAAVRWRINAAILDTLIVIAACLLACWAFHWRVLTVRTWVVISLVHLLYHFVFEALGGQTFGKHRYGVQVFSIDGGPASGGQVALRTILRVVDQLPAWYVSGLVSMVLTGRARRQRLGDRVGRTLVLAVDREAATLGTPPWLLPVLASIALLASAGSVYATIHAGDTRISDVQRSEFIAGCQHGAGAAVLDCGCLLDRLEAAGYDTPNKLRDFFGQIRQAALSRNPAALPSGFVGIAGSCRR